MHPAIAGKHFNATKRTLWSQIYADQSHTLSEFWHDPRFRAPMIVIWVATFGGALHAPVTSYYYLKLGASPTDIGTIGMIGAAGVVLNPVYGYLQDTKGAYPIMCVSCGLCAVGCCIRGFASDIPTLYVASGILGLGGGNLWTVVLSYVASNADPPSRSMVAR